jgi:hypothetical protein
MENNHTNQEEEQVEAPKQPTDTALAKNKTKNKPKNQALTKTTMIHNC